MKTFNRSLLAAALGFALSGFAFANDPQTQTGEPVDSDPIVTDTMTPVDSGEVTFAQLDTDADGYLTATDIPAEHELSMQFSSADTDNDARLSQAEFDAFSNSLEEDEIGE